MKKRIMNIRPQEVTQNGERSVQYKGSDGKLHSMLPQDAAIPVVQRTAIEAGTEITLAQAHEIEDFDFNKCSSLGFTKEFSVYEEISVNREEDGTNYLYLHYPGQENIYIKTDGSVYEPFSDKNEAELKKGFQYPYDDAKSFLAEALLAIAKQTGKLVIFHQDQSHEMVPGYYENAIVLTMAEDIVTSEEFFMESFTGDLLKLPIGGSSTAQSGNIVMEIMFGNENRIFTAEELVTLVSQVLAGKNIVCISNNNWGTNNERRIALVTRIKGFEVADGVVTISDTLNLNFSNCQDFDLDTVYFIKQVDGSYKMQYEFSK